MVYGFHVSLNFWTCLVDMYIQICNHVLDNWISSITYKEGTRDRKPIFFSQKDRWVNDIPRYA